MEIKSKIENCLLHTLRIKGKNQDSIKRTIKGENAVFHAKSKSIVCNFEKFGAPAFHEIGHQLNANSSNYIVKGMSKIRNPLFIFGTAFISCCAMFTDKKRTKEEEHWNDRIKNNCGKLTVLACLPLTIEECMANIRGTAIAKRAGVSGENLKKVLKCHKLSILSYCCSAITAGLAAWGGNKIRDEICSYKK